MTIPAVLIAVELIAVRTLDGREVFINPHAITALTEPKDADSKLFSDRVQCIVSLLDQHFVTVTETCEAIRQRLKEKPQ